MDRQSKTANLFGKLTVILLALSLLVCLLPGAAQALEGNVALTGNSQQCRKGDTVSVFFTIPSEAYVCDFTALISYDANLLKPVWTEKANGETVLVDSEVFAAGVSANLVENEGIRVAGATAQAGYKEGGELLIVRFEVLEDIPETGTQIGVSFSVFHVAKTADVTEEKSVSVTPAKLTPGEKQQEQRPATEPAATTQPREPAATQPTENTSEPAVTPTEGTSASPEQPSQPSAAPTTVGQESAEPTTVPREPAQTTEPAEPTTGSAETTAPASTQPDETVPATIPETTVPNGTQPSGGEEKPDAESPVGLILGICGGIAVIAGIILFVFQIKKKQKEA